MRKNPIDRICLNCQKPFQTLQCKIRYCSYSCSGSVNARKVAPKPIEERFWPKVDTASSPYGCWLWTGAKKRMGYGNLSRGGRDKGWVLAHRLAWELLIGPIPENMCLLHNCPGGDNPSCVNPAHLFLGTRPENQQDMAKKGRSASSANGRHITVTAPEKTLKGVQQKHAKLTDAAVREIRRRGTTESFQHLANEYGVSSSLVSNVFRRKVWRHVLDI